MGAMNRYWAMIGKDIEGASAQLAFHAHPSARRASMQAHYLASDAPDDDAGNASTMGVPVAFGTVAAVASCIIISAVSIEQ